jgi:hypothetical protein
MEYCLDSEGLRDRYSVRSIHGTVVVYTKSKLLGSHTWKNLYIMMSHQSEQKIVLEFGLVKEHLLGQVKKLLRR